MSKCPNNSKSDGGLSAVLSAGSSKNTDWYVDSGASVHLTANKHWLKYSRNPDLSEIVVANSSKMKVKSAGSVEITTMTDKKHKVLLKEVQYVPDLTTNLLSVYQLIKMEIE